MEITEKKVTLGEIEIACYLRGEGDETVLMLMGLGGRAADWGDAVPDGLARRYRVITLDNRGTGASSKPRGTYPIDRMADDAVGVLGSLGVRRVHLVGLSMGGLIAQSMALRYPDLVGKLVLLSTGPGGGEMVASGLDIARLLVPPRGQPAAVTVRNTMRAIAAPGFADAHPDEIDRLVSIAMAQPTPVRTFLSHYQAVRSTDFTARLKEIRAGTLVIHGDRDPLVPFSNGENLAAGIPGARFHALPGCGHLAMWEQSEELARILLDFFEKGDIVGGTI